jgi:hypothetical protein
MKKTLSCSCGGNMSYKTDKPDNAAFIDKLFHDNHTGEGHEVTEQPDVYIGDEEESD